MWPSMVKALRTCPSTVLLSDHLDETLIRTCPGLVLLCGHVDETLKYMSWLSVTLWASMMKALRTCPSLLLLCGHVDESLTYMS